MAKADRFTVFGDRLHLILCIRYLLGSSSIAIAFIGTSDPWSIVSEVQALSQKQQVPMYTYENANHSLETTDTLENLKILQDVMGKTKGFLERK